MTLRQNLTFKMNLLCQESSELEHFTGSKPVSFYVKDTAQNQFHNDKNLRTLRSLIQGEALIEGWKKSFV